LIERSTTDESGNVVEKYAYDPWGVRRNPDNWTQRDSRTTWIVNRGYTGHEHLDAFGIINMNGRVYDPATGMFFSPDPYLQAPGNWLNYNRYSYCSSNPLKYTDPSGQYAVIDDIIAAAIGGIINLGVNAFQGNLGGHGFWEGVGRGFAAFGAGAVSGFGALYPQFGGWAWGGAVVGGTNTWLGGATSFKDIAIGAGVGVISGVAGGAASSWGANNIGGVVVNSLQVNAKSALGGAIIGATGGAVGGYVGGFTGGLIMTGDINAASKSGFSGMAMGAGIGGGTGAVGGYFAAKNAHMNPWTGKALNSVIIGGPQLRVDQIGKLFGNETISNKWPEGMPAYLDKDVPNPNALEFNQQWIIETIKSQSYIYDAGRSGYSPFYNGIEVNTIMQTNYSNYYRITYLDNINTIIIHK